MKSIKNVYLIIGSLVITGCQTTTSSIESKADGLEKDARIRLYGQNQKPSILKYEHKGKIVKFNVGGDAKDALASLTRTVKNSTLGIAQTEMSKNVEKQNGILSKAFYKEFMIPSGIPVTVSNSFVGLTNVSLSQIQYQGSCTSSGLTFIPKSGKDYEVVPKHNSSSCGLGLLEIDAKGNTVEVKLEIQK